MADKYKFRVQVVVHQAQPSVGWPTIVTESPMGMNSDLMEGGRKRDITIMHPARPWYDPNKKWC